MRMAVLSLLGIVMSAAIGCARSEPASSPPNVVLITIDALRADFVSYAGHPNRTSPVLDAFARENVVFTQALTSFPGTAPAMPSLMTGLHPNFENVETWSKTTRHGFNDFETDGEHEFPGLTDNLRMLAEILDEAGYETLGFNTNPHLGESTNFDQGFDEYNQFLPYLRQARTERSHPLLGRYPPASVVVDAVLDRLGKGFNRPLFVWIHFLDPHSPYLPPREYARLFGRADTGFTDLEINESLYHLLYTQQGSLRVARDYPSPEERGIDRDRFVDHLLGLYEGEIRFLDDQLETLFDGFKAMGLWDNTMVMLTADHGEEFLDHGHVAHTELTALAEELIRIPLVLKLPDSARQGIVIDDLVRMVDFAPTILDFAGQPNEAGPMEGVSLRELIEGRGMPPMAACYSTIHYNIVRDARWKYRLEKGDDGKRLSVERLFDIVADPAEENDIAELHPDVVDRMREEYQEFASMLNSRRPPAEGPGGGAATEIDPEELKRLEALGYVTD